MVAFDFFKIPTEEENKKVEKFWEYVRAEFAACIGFKYEYENDDAQLCREWIAAKLQNLKEFIDNGIIEMCYKTQEVSPLARTLAKIFRSKNEEFFKNNNAFEFFRNTDGKVVCKAFVSEGA